jgi:hypothetical protein
MDCLRSSSNFAHIAKRSLKSNSCCGVDGLKFEFAMFDRLSDAIKADICFICLRMGDRLICRLFFDFRSWRISPNDEQLLMRQATKGSENRPALAIIIDFNSFQLPGPWKCTLQAVKSCASLSLNMVGC